MKFRTRIAAVLGVLALLPVGSVPANEPYDLASFYWISDGPKNAVAPQLAAAAGQPSCGEQCNSGCGGQCDSGSPARCRASRWTAQADLMYMQRCGAPDVTLISLVGPPPTQELTNAKDFNLGWHGGPRLSLSTYGDRGNDLEVVYFSIDGWWDSQAQNVPTGVQFTAPDFQALAFGASGMKFDWTSKLYNAEVNLWVPQTDRLRVMAGFRWIETRESLIGTFVSPGGVTPFWSTKTDNHLYGFQIGADTRLLDRGGPFYVTTAIKAGIYRNYAQQVGSAVGTVLEAEETRTAFESDVTLAGVYEVSRCLSVRLGYQFMWLDGVAVAPSQIHVTNVSTRVASVDTDGAVFYHGAVAGLELKF
jgi:hypothetical protein